MVSAKEKNINISPPVSTEKNAWADNRPVTKDATYNASQKEKFENSFKGNEFLTINEALEAVNTRTISLLTSDIKTWKLIGISRDAMEDALKINPKVLARRTNALWDILLQTEQQAKELAGSILNTKDLRLQTE